MSIGLLLLVVALVLAAVAAIQERVGPVHLGWVAIALWFLSQVIGG